MLSTIKNNIIAKTSSTEPTRGQSSSIKMKSQPTCDSVSFSGAKWVLADSEIMNMAGSVRRILKKKQEILNALMERTPNITQKELVEMGEKNGFIINPNNPAIEIESVFHSINGQKLVFTPTQNKGYIIQDGSELYTIKSNTDGRAKVQHTLDESVASVAEKIRFSQREKTIAKNPKVHEPQLIEKAKELLKILSGNDTTIVHWDGKAIF